MIISQCVHQTYIGQFIHFYTELWYSFIVCILHFTSKEEFKTDELILWQCGRSKDIELFDIEPIQICYKCQYYYSNKKIEMNGLGHKSIEQKTDHVINIQQKSKHMFSKTLSSKESCDIITYTCNSAASLLPVDLFRRPAITSARFNSSKRVLNPSVASATSSSVGSTSV